MNPRRTTIVALVVLFAVYGVLHVGFYHRHLILDTPLYQGYGSAMVHGRVPYRDFELEYPPGSLPVFVVPALAWPDVRQLDHYNHAFQGLMFLCAIGALLGMRKVRGGWPLFAFALAPLLIGSLVLYRFDLWPAALTVAAVAMLKLRREPLAFALLATAVAAKLWPAVLLPLFLVAARARLRAAALFTAVLAAWFVPFMVVAPGGVWDSVRGQASRPLEIESLGASALVLAGADVRLSYSHRSWNLRGEGTNVAAAVSTVLQFVTLLAVWTAFVLGRRDLVRWSAAAVGCFVAFGKVLSPQFLIWLLPLVPLVRGRRGIIAAILLAAALVLTQIVFPFRFFEYASHLDRSLAAVVLFRNLLLVAIVAALVWPSRTPQDAGRIEHGSDT
jgi:uncharacterized membrane protein